VENVEALKKVSSADNDVSDSSNSSVISSSRSSRSSSNSSSSSSSSSSGSSGASSYSDESGNSSVSNGSNNSVANVMEATALLKVDNPKQKDFINSNNQNTQKYIDESFTQGKINVQVGDCVQFILDGKLVKAIICFFKSGKYTYDNKLKIKYEAASNIVDYWRSLEGKIQTVVNEKEREPLNLISLLNLRGFAFLPYQESDDKQTYTILYDCKSEIKRLHNGYNPAVVSQAFKSFANTIIPVSTEFTVESIGALQFNTASYMTLRKIEEADRPETMKEFSAHLQSLGMADEGTITKSIQTYIQQYGLSKLCGKMVSPTDVNRQNLFKQKVMNVDREFYDSGVFNMKANQYNVYKSNIFIQGLLDEKISDEDSVALFQTEYDPSVPELIYWFFTAFARINPTRAMIMVFQAFAHDSAEDDGFKINSLETLPGSEHPGDDNFTGGQVGGTIPADAAAAAAAADAAPSGDGDGGSGDEEDEEEEIENDGGTATSADPISNYIKRLIDIVKKNGLYDPGYLNTLMSALKAAKLKYKSKSESDKRLFSASTAEPERAEAAMQEHIKNAESAAKTAADAAKQAKADAEKKSREDEDLRHQRQVELAAASNGAMSKGKGAFDLSSLLKSRDGSNIENQLGTCISGNNVVISCDGQTVRIDLDLATLLSTCADSFTLSGLNGNKPNVEAPSGPPGGDQTGIEQGEGEGEEGDEGDEEGEEGDEGDEGDEEAAAKKKAAADAAAKKKAAAKAAASGLGGKVSKVSATTIDSVKAEYDAYDTDYKKFKDDATTIDATTIDATTIDSDKSKSDIEYQLFEDPK
jgi:hypothetical protein